MKNKITDFLQILQYQFDSILSGGIGKILVWFSIVTIFTVLICTCIVSFTHPLVIGHGTFLDLFWFTLTTVIEPGLHEFEGWMLRLTLVLIALVGLFFMGSATFFVVRPGNG